MIKKSYFNDYIKNYLWKFIGFSTGLLSMLVVVPSISENSVVFGVYSICISISIFLGYADIGFYSAGMKYAGESFAKDNREEEYSIFGLTGFILIIFVTLIAIVYFVFAIYPSLIIKTTSPDNYIIATKLLIIQAIFSYNTFLNRIIDGVFMIRVESYIFQKYGILGNILKIISIFYFFSDQNYDIVSYFLFLKLVDFTIIIIGLIISKRRYNYDYISVIKRIKFNRELFLKVKGLAFSSLFVTIMWIIYYELDVIVIGKFLGPESVALFAVGYTFARAFRSISSILFSPFQARFNLLIGIMDVESLRTLVLKVIRFTMPLIVFPIISIVFLSKNIILTWVGSNFDESIIVLILLMLSASFSFIIIPADNLIVTLVRTKSLYSISIAKVLVFWIGVILTISFIGIYSFPLFRLISNIIVAILYIRIILPYLNISFYGFLQQTIFKMAFPLIIQILLLLIFINFLPETKSRINFLYVASIGGLISLLSFITLYISSSGYKNEYDLYFSKLFKNFKVMVNHQHYFSQ
jgi:O-antigen/teichoic acid export membrane protein